MRTVKIVEFGDGGYQIKEDVITSLGLLSRHTDAPRSRRAQKNDRFHSHKGIPPGFMNMSVRQLSEVPTGPLLECICLKAQMGNEERAARRC